MPVTTLTPSEIQSRNLEIHNLFNRGHTLQSIGETYGLTRERVRQITNSMDLEPRRATHINRLNTLKNRLLALAERYKNEIKVLSIQNVVDDLDVTEYIARKLFRETGLHIEFPHRFTKDQIYRVALKVKNGSSIAKASGGDRYLAILVGDYCKAHNIPVRYSRWQDMSPRNELITTMRATDASWREIAEAVSIAENRKISGSAIYQYAKGKGLIGNNDYQERKLIDN